MDFTVVDEKYEFDEVELKKILYDITLQSGILFYLSEFRHTEYNGQKTGYKAVVKFWGADHPKNNRPAPVDRWHTSLKIEVTQFEKLLFAPEKRRLFHPYSDMSLIIAEVNCYHIHEILAEKLRALIQRKYTAPRDYYDLWFLQKNVGGLDWNAIKDAFFQKMAYKDLQFEGVEEMLAIDQPKAFKIAWEFNLKHHLPSGQLPDFEAILSELKELLNHVFNTEF